MIPKSKLSFVFLFLFYSAFARYNMNSISQETKTNFINKNDSIKSSIKNSFDTALAYYSAHEYKKAIVEWESVLPNLEELKDSLLLVKTKINIGATYNALGYHKTASKYFLNANALLKKDKVKTETYWINHINLGVCYMSLRQLEEAKKYFDTAEEFNPYISFLKKLNTAKWQASKNNKQFFFSLVDELNVGVLEFPMYETIWLEVQFDFLIQWNEILRLEELLIETSSKYDSYNLDLQLLLEKANLLIYKKTIKPAESLVVLNDQILKCDNLYLIQLYYKVLKENAYHKKDTDAFLKYSSLWEKSTVDVLDAKNMVYVEDFKTAFGLEEVALKLNQSELEKAIIKNKLTTSSLRFSILLTVLIFSLLAFFLFRLNYKKSKKIQQLKLFKIEETLRKQKLEEEKISKKLEQASNELNDSILNIKKITLLKKQLEDVFNTSYSSKEDTQLALKNIKICTSSFFDNYKDLSLMMQKRLNVDTILKKITTNYPDLNKKELQILEYIILQFTSKEIAVLVSKSEKSVEYYRTQIRKKIDIPSDVSLEDFLNNCV